jgi:hypothetical protein
MHAISNGAGNRTSNRFNKLSYLFTVFVLEESFLSLAMLRLSFIDSLPTAHVKPKPHRPFLDLLK